MQIVVKIKKKQKELFLQFLYFNELSTVLINMKTQKGNLNRTKRKQTNAK